MPSRIYFSCEDVNKLERLLSYFLTGTFTHIVSGEFLLEFIPSTQASIPDIGSLTHA